MATCNIPGRNDVWDETTHSFPAIVPYMYGGSSSVHFDNIWGWKDGAPCLTFNGLNASHVWYKDTINYSDGSCRKVYMFYQSYVVDRPYAVWYMYADAQYQYQIASAKVLLSSPGTVVPIQSWTGCGITGSICFGFDPIYYQPFLADVLQGGTPMNPVFEQVIGYFHVLCSPIPVTTTTTSTTPVTTSTTTPTTTTTTTTIPITTTTTTPTDTTPTIANPSERIASLKSVETVYLDNVVKNENLGTDSSDSKGTLKTINSTALSLGPLAPGETSRTLIAFLKVPSSIAINNIRLGLTDSGGLDFVTTKFGVEIQSFVDYNIVPSDQFDGINDIKDPYSSYNVSVGNRNLQESNYVYLNVVIPREQMFMSGVIRYKWFFDYA